MHDWQKLMTARKTLQSLDKLGKTGGTLWFSLLFVGKSLETEVAKSLGLFSGDKLKGTVKPL